MLKDNQNLKNCLIQALNQFFELGFAITPLLGNKAPYRDNWQHESPLTRQELVNAIQNGEYIPDKQKKDGSCRLILAKGLGLRTGRISGGIVAIDLDGPSAHPMMLQLSSGEDLPKTVAFTSGRPGRCQYLLRVPEQYWGAIHTKKFKCMVENDARELVQVLGSDGKPEQVELRWDGCQSVLPPSVHPVTGQYHWVKGCAPWECEIASAPLWVIELMLKDQPLAEQQQQSKEHSAHPNTHPNSYTHTDRWTGVDWALSYLNALSPLRTDDYDNWLAVGMALHSVDDSLLVEWDRWSQQSSKYKPGDCDRKWKSFKRSGINIGTLAHMAKQDGWRSPFEGWQSSGTNKLVQIASLRHSAASTPVTGNHSIDGSSDGGNGSDDGTSNSQIGSTPYDLVKDLMSSDKSPAQLSGDLIQLAASTGYQLGGLERLQKEIEAELSTETVIAESDSELVKLLDYRQQDLDLHRIFPEPLAKMLLSKADSDRIDPAFPYLYLLPTVGGQLGGHIALLGKEGETPRDNWLEHPLLWTMPVALPSSGKSQTQRTIMGPIKRCQDSTRANYKKSLKYIEQLEKEWQRLSTEQRDELKDSAQNPNTYREQMPPAPRIYLIEGGSPEGAFKRMGEQGAKNGVVLVFDELSRLLALDQYKSHGGDTRQLLLTAWNGPLSLELHRVEDSESIHLNQICLSLTGGIQPARVRKLMADPDDGDGLLSRLLIGTIKTPENFAQWSNTKVAVDEALSGLYEHLRNLHYDLREYAGNPEFDEDGQQPTVVLRFARDAEERWHRWWSELRRGMKATEHENPALYGYLGKMLSQTLRLALGLHAIELKYETKANPLQVGFETLERAIYAATWHIGQFRLLQAGTDNTSLPGDLAKIHQYAMRKGKEVSAEQVQNSVFKRYERKPTLVTIRQWFGVIALAGAAALVGAGRDLKMKAIALANKVASAVGIPTSSAPYSDKAKKTESAAFQVTEEFETKNSDNSDNSAFTENMDDSLPFIEGVEGLNENSSPNCQNCRNDSEGVLSNPSPETVLAKEALSENQSDDVGDSDNPDDNPEPDDSEPGGGVPSEPAPDDSDGSGGTELPRDEELQGWLNRMEACANFDDCLAYLNALDQLPQTVNKQIWESAGSLLPRFWKVAEIEAKAEVPPTPGVGFGVKEQKTAKTSTSASQAQSCSFEASAKCASQPQPPSPAAAVVPPVLKTGMWVRCVDGFYGHLGAMIRDGRWWVHSPKSRKVDTQSRLYAAADIQPMPTS